MPGIVKPPAAFAITPHKVSLCLLLQIYSPSPQISVPFPFSSVAQHNHLGLFLLALTKSCDDILELKLDELISQLKQVCGLSNHRFIDHLTSKLSSLSSPDDLFNFFTEMRGILGGNESGVMEDDRIILDPGSNLGMFLRRCILAFNLLSFEGVCHLLTNIGLYCKEALSCCPPYEATCLEDSSSNLEAFLEYDNMDLENFVFKKVKEEIEARKQASERVPFHLHGSKALFGLVEDIVVPGDPKSKDSAKGAEASPYVYPQEDASGDFENKSGIFLRANRQIQGYLQEQADAIQKNGSSLSLNGFELVLRRLHKLAPELHRVHLLRYLNSLYHDDYFAALENLHRYFDYSFEVLEEEIQGSNCIGHMEDDSFLYLVELVEGKKWLMLRK
ncbi:Anaphase-promoting complex subunit 5 [Morella rubra]|uniref:Anaphase-promoting complex subunit 5 n=1 Tax=Morella rubra TaxID=262757 RepID=A0A6A1WNM6_9ROSI|nr:Anaphase-promoting complex subunit 5 [Morella rubra]